MNLRTPLKRLAAFASAVAVGLAVAAAVSTPAEANQTNKGGGGHHKLDVTTEVWGEAECKSGEWHVTWHLEDTTDTNKQYQHWVHSVATQTKGGPWFDPTFEAGSTLVKDADVPKAGDGELTSLQILPGDTEWVKIKAPTWWSQFGHGGYGWGTTPGVAEKLYLGECEPEPPVVTLSSDCFEYTVVLDVLENGVLTEFTISTNAGHNEAHSVGPDDEALVVTIPIEYDGGDDPLISVAWDGGSAQLVLEDYKSECVGDSTATITADCIQFTVVLDVPEDGLTTTFGITNSSGEPESHTLDPADEALTLYYLIEFDGENQPWIEVEWGYGEYVEFEFEDYDAECIAYSDLTGSLWPECDGVAYEFLNAAVQNGGVTFEVRMEPSEGENVVLTLEPDDYVEGTIPASSTSAFSVDIYVDDELEGTFDWEYAADECDDAPPPAEGTTPVAQDKLAQTGSSLTITVASALALAVAGAVLFFLVRRRRAAENW